MGKATDLIDEMVMRPLSADEIRRRQQAARPRTQRVATLNGQLTELAPTPREAPRIVHQAPEQTID